MVIAILLGSGVLIGGYLLVKAREKEATEKELRVLKTISNELKQKIDNIFLDGVYHILSDDGKVWTKKQNTKYSSLYGIFIELKHNKTNQSVKDYLLSYLQEEIPTIDNLKIVEQYLTSTANFVDKITSEQLGYYRSSNTKISVDKEDLSNGNHDKIVGCEKIKQDINDYFNDEDFNFSNYLTNQRNLLLDNKERILYNIYVTLFGEVSAYKLMKNELWIGMTKNELLMVKGNPTKIDIEHLKTKTKETYIYGNKNSGDYFVLENDSVTKIVDR
jgi:hypothetical protein